MEPTSELPWTVTAPQPGVRKGATGDAPAIPPPPDSVWDSTPARHSSAPRSLFEPAPAPVAAPRHSRPPTEASQPGSDQPRRSAGGFGGSSSRTDTAGGFGGSSSRTDTAGGFGGPPTRADTPQWQEPPGPGRQRSRAESERGPVFMWNPTDEFAAVDENGRELPRRSPHRRRD
jgi:hypothetical protein